MQDFFEGLFKNKRGDQEARWDKTHYAEERVKRQGFYEEQGWFHKEQIYQGRPIIGRDRPIDGGVYLGGSDREAIVVDGQKDPALQRLYSELLQRRAEAARQGSTFKDGLLVDVWSLVRQVMPYNQHHVDEVVRSLKSPTSKVYLSGFIGGGVCRHQALLAGYLLERMAKEKLVRGKVSVDRNYVKGEGGHAWTRYENSVGDVYIIDPAQNYFGRLDDMSEAEDRWFYERPEDTNPKLKQLLRFKRALLGR